jgi:hypothetical protein
VGIAFFDAGAVSVVLRRLWLWTSLKPSSYVGFSVALPADLLAFKMDLEPCKSWFSFLPQR